MMPIRPTRITTNRTTPTGGVTSPIARVTMITMLACKGSMPSARTAGIRRGTKIRIAAPMSRKVPRTSISAAMANRNRIGLP